MAADLPDLADDDPRTEPAARERALQWIHNALQLAGQPEPHTTLSRVPQADEDARTVLEDQTGHRDTTQDWAIHRFVTAAAEAAAITLRSAGRLDVAQQIFTQD
jgi:hypothetical protein